MDALLEIAALQAVHGDNIIITDAGLQQLVDRAADASLNEAELSAWEGCNTMDVVFRCRGASSSVPYGATNTAPPGAPSALEVELRLRLPPGYPAAQAACCSGVVVTRGRAGRAWVDGVTVELIGMAQAAAVEGRPCLHELCDALAAAAAEAGQAAEAETRALQQPLQEAQGSAVAGTAAGAGAAAPSSSACSGSAGPGAQGCTDPCMEVLLLRLDHMRNRGLYTRTIGAWIKELGLTGRLVFQASLILILLEGPAEALRSYLVRHRTEAVDVDSHGRKCKERMMDVVVQQAAAAGAAGTRAFADFRHVALNTLEEVGGVLAQAGLAGWLRAAAGLR